MKKEEIGAAAVRSQCLSAPRPAEDHRSEEKRPTQRETEEIRKRFQQPRQTSHHQIERPEQPSKTKRNGRQRGTAPGQVIHTTTMSDDDLMCLSFCVSAEIVL